jgi:G3E family GTPase
MFEGCADREWREGEDRRNKLVFIGKDLDEELLKEGFEDCLHVKPVVAELVA